MNPWRSEGTSMERVHFLDQPQATEHDGNGLGSHRIPGGRGVWRGRIDGQTNDGFGRFPLPGWVDPNPSLCLRPSTSSSSSSSILCPFYFACAHSAKPRGPSYVRSAVSFHRASMIRAWRQRTKPEPLVSIYRKVSSILTGSTQPIRPSQSTRPDYFN